MELSLRDLAYLAAMVGMLFLFRRLRGIFWVFALAVLPGTLCHELCHLGAGLLLNGRPARFSLLPRREGQTWILGSVGFAHVRWYNAFFLGAAPLLLLPLAYGLLAWRLGGRPGLSWGEGLWLYGIANLVYASLPSWQDLRIAARSPVGWLLLAAAAAWGWHRLGTAPLQQHKVPGLSRRHPAFGNPGQGIGAGQGDQIG
jgi:hypothetical protein